MLTSNCPELFAFRLVKDALTVLLLSVSMVTEVVPTEKTVEFPVLPGWHTVPGYTFCPAPIR
jgi:hypothetical protein